MEITSPAYRKEMAKTHRDRAYLRVRMGVIDLDAYQDASLSDNGHMWFSSLTGVVFEDAVPDRTYATFEKGRMRADGRQLVPSLGAPRRQGYASDVLSGQDGAFAARPYIRISFTKKHSCPALTFTFDETTGDYPDGMEVEAYRDGRLLETVAVTPDGSTYVHYHEFINFDGLRLVFGHTHKPYRRVRLQQIIFGAGILFGNSDITTARKSTDIDPLMRRMEESTFDFSIINQGGYDPDRPSGIWSWIEMQQPVKVEHGQLLRSGMTWEDVYASNWESLELTDWRAVYEGGMVEWLNGGRYVLTGQPQLRGSTASFSARSRLTALSYPYNKGQYRPQGVTLYQLAQTLLEELVNDYADQLPIIEEGKKPYYLHPGLQSIRSKAPLPKTTYKDCLQLIAAAAGMVACTDRTGMVRIEPRSMAQHDYELDFDETFPDPLISKTPPAHGALVNYYSYRPADERKELADDEYEAGTHTAEFDFAEDVRVQLGHAVTVRVSGPGGSTDEALRIAVVDIKEPEIMTEKLEPGTVSRAYGAKLEVTGSRPVTLRVASGSLPAGLEMDSAGNITGEPAHVCMEQFTVEAKNSEGAAYMEYIMNVGPLAPPEIKTSSLPGAAAGYAYNAQLACEGETPMFFEVIEGAPPAGVTVYDTGAIIGTPAAAGSNSFTVRVSNVAGSTIKKMSLSVAEAPEAPEISTTSLAAGTAGEQYINKNGTNISLAAKGTAPVTFGLASGTLPPGLTLQSDGRITGTPGSLGSHQFTVAASNMAGVAYSRPLIITVNAAKAPSLKGGALPDAVRGVAYSYQLEGKGSGDLRYTIVSGTLPAGLSLSSGGTLTGVPTNTYVTGVRCTSGTATFTTSKAGEVTVTGRPLETTSASVTAVHAPEGELYEVENPLITDRATAAARANEARDYLACRTTYEFDYRGSPELDAMDHIYSQSRYTRKFPSLVLKHDLEFNGALRGRVTEKNLGDV